MAMFSKRHYEALARLIRQTDKHLRPSSANPDVAMWDHCMDSLKESMVSEFKADNPRFDAERFNKACEPKGGE